METKKKELIIDLGFTNVLFFIFLILKLCGVIGWSWVWVCAPLWIPVAILVAIFAAIFIIGGIAWGICGLYVCIYNLIMKWRE